MMGKFAQIACLIASLGLTAAELQADEFQLGPMPTEGVLLLGNGHVVWGTISRTGDLYYVVLPNGEIRLRASEVDFFCRDLEDGYHRKRAALRQGDVRDHLDLAQWCLRHELLGHAGRELADALQIEPRHPMIAVLDRRLQMAMRPPPKRVAAKKSTQTAPSIGELDKLVLSMPAGSMEMFTQTIQPLLANSCTTAACHGPGASADFRLLRLPPARLPSRLTTLRNLHATLQWVDRDEPASSRLLTAVVAPHGTAETPIFANRRAEQYGRLVAWVHRVAAVEPPRIPQTVSQTEQPPVRAMTAKMLGFDFTTNAAEPINPSTPPVPAEPFGETQPAPIGRNVKDPFNKPFPIISGSPLGDFIPIDPFDPEIFNRRFFGPRLP